MTKAITILTLACFLVLGTAAVGILSRDGIPAPGKAASLLDVTADPVANRSAKQDKLTVAPPALHRLQTETSSEPLRQAFAASSDADIDAAKLETPAPVVHAVRTPPKPKVASPKPQKSYALLSDAQIAGIKQRLKLSSNQESYWPPVENALRLVARKIHAVRQADPNANAGTLDPDSPEVQQLKSAAMPFLFQLREDQKDEVRKLARIIGLEKVAAAI